MCMILEKCHESMGIQSYTKGRYNPYAESSKYTLVWICYSTGQTLMVGRKVMVGLEVAIFISS